MKRKLEHVDLRVGTVIEAKGNTSNFEAGQLARITHVSTRGFMYDFLLLGKGAYYSYWPLTSLRQHFHKRKEVANG